MAGVKALLILTVAAFNLPIVPWGVWTDQFMPDAQFGGGFLKQSRQVTLTAGEAIGKLGTVVRLDTLHLDPAARIPRG